jgi:hypothetical protein
MYLCTTGALGYVPFSLAVNGTGARSVAGILVALGSSFLFGVTYRYDTCTVQPPTPPPPTPLFSRTYLYL